VNVLVAMSGGVDSSVAAALLREDGHDVVGVTMKLWGGESDTGCCSVGDVDDARRVAQQLDIDHVVFNFADDFAAHVVGPYVEAHARGATPNPCVECNRHLKFDRLAERAELLGFDALATGHHARVVGADGRPRLARGVDRAKDQSYVLHMLDRPRLARTLLPVGSMTKAAVRQRAGALGLRTAGKPDSQDVCFITARGRGAFLGGRTELHPGRVVDTAGRRIGEVAAVELVTVGQRRGLGLSGGGATRYVVDVDVAQGAVTVGSETDLLVGRQVVHAWTWVDDADPRTPADVLVQCSAHGDAQPAVLALAVDGVVLEWREPHRRVAPGQSVVAYDLTNTYVVGGGVAASR
jgi:tRNA-specific 2-thiouridylase